MDGATIEKILLKIEADATGLRTAMQQAGMLAQNGANQVGRAFDDMSRRGSALDGTMNKLKGVFTSSGVTLLALVGIGFAFSETLSKMITNAAEAERVSTRLDQTLSKFGKTAGLVRGDIERVVGKLEELTNFEDDNIRKAADTLITFGNVSRSVFGDALELSADLAAKMGADIPSAARLLARALVEPGEGLEMLRRTGVQLTATQIDYVRSIRLAKGEMEAQRVVIEMLTEKVGGTAQEDRKGLYGSLTNTTKAWNEFLEALGSTPAVSGAVGMALWGLEDILKRLKKAVEPLSQEDQFNELATKLARAERQLQADERKGTASAFQRDMVNRLREKVHGLSDSMGGEAPPSGAPQTTTASDKSDPSRLHRDFANLAKELGLTAEGFEVVDKAANDYFSIQQGLNRILEEVGDDFLPTYVQMMEILGQKMGEASTPHGKLLKQLEEESRVLRAQLQDRERVAFELQVEAALVGKVGAERERLKNALMAEYDAREALRRNAKGDEAAMQRENERLAAIEKGTEDATKAMQAKVLAGDALRAQAEEQLRNQQEVNDVLKRSNIEWDEASQAMRINTREADILAKTQDILAKGMANSAEQARELATAMVDAAEVTRKTQATNERLKRDAERNAEMMMEPFKNALRGIQDAFSDFFVQLFEGGVKSFSDLGTAAKRIFIRLAAELASLMVIRPVLGGVLSSVGMGGVAQQMGMGGGGGGFNLGALFGGGSNGANGSNGSMGNPFNLLSSINNIPSMFSGNGMFSANGISNAWSGVSNFFSNPFGLFGSSAGSGATLALPGYGGGMIPTGPGGLLVGGGATSSAFATGPGGLLAGGGVTSSGGAMAGGAFSLGGALGAAGIGFGIGQLSRSLFGGSRAAGMIGGGIGGGIAGGALAGTAIMPGIGTAAGAIIGAIAGILGGGLGGKKSVGPVAIANLGFSNGKFTVGPSAGDNGGDPSSAVAEVQKVADALNKTVEGFGLTPSALLNSGGGSATIDNLGTTIGSAITTGNYGGPWAKSGDELFARVIASGQLTSDKTGINTALRSASGASSEQILKNLETGALYDKVIAMERPLTAVEEAMKELSKTFDEAVPKVTALGLNVGAFTAKFKEAFDRDIADKVLEITDPMKAALEFEERNAKARLDTARKLGADIAKVEELNALERKRIADQFAEPEIIAPDPALAYLSDISPLDPMSKFNHARNMFLKGSLGKDQFATIARATFASTDTFANIFQDLYGPIPGRAGGGPALGMTRVGEFGPEIVHFNQPAMVYPSGVTPGNDNMSAANDQIVAALAAQMKGLRDEFSRMNRELALGNQRRRYESSRGTR
jgi:hypothetical protein